jgi:hypothetical protein
VQLGAFSSVVSELCGRGNKKYQPRQKDHQFNVLSANLGITGIPNYTLIDKVGNIVLKSAHRPSQKNDLIKEIERQLNKSNEIK